MKCSSCGHKKTAHDEWGCVWGMRFGVPDCPCRLPNKSAIIEGEIRDEHSGDPKSS